MKGESCGGLPGTGHIVHRTFAGIPAELQEPLRTCTHAMRARPNSLAGMQLHAQPAIPSTKGGSAARTQHRLRLGGLLVREVGRSGGPPHLWLCFSGNAQRDEGLAQE